MVETDGNLSDSGVAKSEAGDNGFDKHAAGALETPPSKGRCPGFGASRGPDRGGKIGVGWLGAESVDSWADCEVVETTAQLSRRQRRKTATKVKKKQGKFDGDSSEKHPKYDELVALRSQRAAANHNGSCEQMIVEIDVLLARLDSLV